VARERMARMLAERDSDCCVILIVFGGLWSRFSLDVILIKFDIFPIKLEQARVFNIVNLNGRLSDLRVTVFIRDFDVEVGAVETVRKNGFCGRAINCADADHCHKFHVEGVFMH
jgi:hypothetical protein